MKYKRLFKSVLWNVTGSVYYLFTQWLFIVIVTKISGFYDAGILSLAVSITALFNGIAFYGFRNYHVADTDNVFSQNVYFTTRFYTGLLSFLACFIFVILSRYDTQQAVAILFYMLFRIIESFVDFSQGVFQKLWRMDLIAFSYYIRGTISIISLSLVLYFFNNVALAILFITVLNLLALLFLDFRNIGNKVEKLKICFLSPDNWKLLRICLPLCLYLVISSAIIVYPRYEIEKVFGEYVLGIFSSIATPVLVVQAAASFIILPILNIFSDKLAKNEIKTFFKLFIGVLSAILVSAVPIVILFNVFGDTILTVLFSEEIKEYLYLLNPILMIIFLTIISWFETSILTVLKCNKSVLVLNAIGLALCLATCRLLIGRFGLNGANYSVILGLGVQNVLLFIRILKVLKKERVSISGKL